jgi:Predicted membrane protein
MISRTPWKLAQEAATKFFDDSPFQFSAALSFYTVLSLSPLVLIVVAAAGLVWGEQSVRSELLSQSRT